MIQLLAAPFAACLVLTGIHCYLGIHVVMRGVIFVDLALAQIAALGAVVGVLWGYDAHSAAGYVVSLVFTFLGAAIFSLARFRRRHIPQEAIIGIVYAVGAALAILILSKTAVDREEIERMLTGRLLFVDWAEVGSTLLIYLPVGVLHYLLRRPFFAITCSPETAMERGLAVRRWDLLFYMTFGLVVTSSVQIAGVLLVFSFLVVPAVCAMMFFDRVSARLLAGWGFGCAASVLGLVISAGADVPTGAAVVAAFGILVVVCAVLYALRGPRSAGRDRAHGA
jgi:zinc/manganese transport system permease protein